MKKIAIVSHDQVNEAHVRQEAEERGALLQPLTLGDPPPNGDFERVLIDWDSLDRDGREELLARMLASPEPGRVGLTSYNLNRSDARTLRRKGVAVFERFVPDAVEWLLSEA